MAIVVGIVGALLASFLFGRATLTSGSFTPVSLLWSLLGAVILLVLPSSSSGQWGADGLALVV